MSGFRHSRNIMITDFNKHINKRLNSPWYCSRCKDIPLNTMKMSMNMVPGGPKPNGIPFETPREAVLAYLSYKQTDGITTAHGTSQIQRTQ